MGSIFLFTLSVILITELALSSPLSQYPGKIDCQMRDNTGLAVNYKLTVTFGNDSSVYTNQWHLILKNRTIEKQNYWVESCSPTFDNSFCEKWKTKSILDVCKTASNSSKCNIEILSTESSSTKPNMYAVFLNYNATHTWKRKGKFPTEQLIIDEPKCFYNQTHINITLELKYSSELYINLTLLNKQIVRNLSKSLEISRKELKEINLRKFPANVSLCVHRWCTKCGVTRLFTCYSKHPHLVSHSAKKSYFSTTIIVTLGTVGGLLFVSMCTSLLWFIFAKRKINTDLIYPPSNEPMYAEVQEPHIYDELDIWTFYLLFTREKFFYQITSDRVSIY